VSQRRGAGVLLAIAIFKLFKSCALITLGVGALSLVHDSDVYATLRHIVGALRLDPHNHFIDAGMSRVSGLSPTRLEELGIGTFVYAAVFLVEGTGLLLRKRWAEYLTIIVTASFIPFEIYELLHHPTVLKAVGTFVNAAIVAYLVLRVRREHREDKTTGGATKAA
jgi:uncharacterized membrane protein (DUF2068 family)